MSNWNPDTDYWCSDGNFYEHECEECGVDFRSPREWSTLCKACLKASKGQSANRVARNAKAETPFIPDEMLKRLLQLCHPDKHDGSIASQKATQWLLDHRRR